MTPWTSLDRQKSSFPIQSIDLLEASCIAFRHLACARPRIHGVHRRLRQSWSACSQIKTAICQRVCDIPELSSHSFGDLGKGAEQRHTLRTSTQIGWDSKWGSVWRTDRHVDGERIAGASFAFTLDLQLQQRSKSTIGTVAPRSCCSAATGDQQVHLCSKQNKTNDLEKTGRHEEVWEGILILCRGRASFWLSAVWIWLEVGVSYWYPLNLALNISYFHRKLRATIFL